MALARPQQTQSLDFDGDRNYSPKVKPVEGVDIRTGDCLALMSEIPARSVHMVLTDPPYFLDGMGTEWNDVNLKRRAGKASVVGGLPVGMKFDPAQVNRLHAFYKQVGKQVERVLAPGGFFLSFSQPRLSFAVAMALHEVRFEIRDIYTWHYTKKTQFKAFSMNHFIERMSISATKKKRLIRNLMGRKTPQLRSTSELIIMAQKPRNGTFIENWEAWNVGLIDATQKLHGQVPSTVMEIEKPVRDRYNCHLTVKPVPLLEHLIRVFSTTGQTILDPFLGSGSTAIAALATDRNCIGIEINESYVDIAEKRLKDWRNEHSAQTR